MTKADYMPFERAPQPYDSAAERGSLTTMLAAVGRYGAPSDPVLGYHDYWQQFIGAGDSPTVKRELPHVDKRLILPLRRRGSLAVAGSISVLGELAKPLPDARVPVAVAGWHADIYDSDTGTEHVAIVWGSHEISRMNRSQIGVSIALTIGPAANMPYTLPDSIREFWDALRLRDLMDYPETGPVVRMYLDGRAPQIRALTRFMLGQESD